MGIHNLAFGAVSARSPWYRLCLSGGITISLVVASILSATAQQTLPPPPSIGSPDLSQPQPLQADGSQLPPPPQQTITPQPLPTQPSNWQAIPAQPSQPFNASPSASPGAIPRYLVVLPGDRMGLPLLVNQVTRVGIQQNAIQVKNAPYGPHLAIGPFVTYKEAEGVTDLLRQNGMQSARVFFLR
ncbi:MAG: hypothetical protein ACKO24_08685 [Leptolyngbyaceae cyanobacterium]